MMFSRHIVSCVKYVYLIHLCCLLVTKAQKYGPNWEKKYDYIIVGGGTSGCVLANRLSEDPDVSVLVIEAGKEPTDPFIPIPKTFFDTMLNPETDWAFKIEPQDFTGPDQRLTAHQAKVLGGGSSHNGNVYVRGSRHDYDRWADKYGNTGWTYYDVLPYFKKFEDMADTDLANNGFHGKDGPIKTRFGHVEEITEDIIKGGVEAGFEYLQDYNGPEQEGIGRLQVMVDKTGHRSSAYTAYLKPVKGRRNLHVKTEAFVTKVELVQKKKSIKATGVHLKTNGGEERFIRAKREVIMCAGAISTPKLLLLSGIGPKEHLKEHNIQPIVDLPVGENFQNHMTGMTQLNVDESAPRKRSKIFTFEAFFEYVFAGTGPWSSVSSMAILSSKTPNQPKENLFPHVLQMYHLPLLLLDEELVQSIRNGSGVIAEKLKQLKKSENDPRFIDIFTLILHPNTRGTVRLRSNNPMDDPVIDYPYFDNKGDIQDFIDGVRITQRLLNTTVFKQGGMTLMGPDSSCKDHVFDTDEYWICHLKNHLLSFHHYIGTCKMAKDKSGVLDNRLRVKGVKGLRVTDSSIMPEHVSSQTTAAVLMIAEKAADIIKEDFMNKS